jgi:Arc/MetJ-type ribon-helix-helix transcriptional regulator
MAAKTDRITVRLPVSLIQSMDALVDLGTYRNRTDVVYNAMKEFVQTQGTKAKETIEAERGLLELKKLAAEMDRMKAQMGLE